MPEQTVSVIIVEQNEPELKKLSSFIKKTKTLKIIGATNSLEEALLMVCRQLPQILILCLQPENRSLKLVKMLHDSGINPQLVFISDDDEMAYHTMQFKPLDYWVKPLKKEMVSDMVERYIVWQKKNELKQKLTIYEKKSTKTEKRLLKQNKCVLFLNPEDIVYCKASLSNTTLFLKNGKTEVCSCGITETINNLNHNDFIKVNRSYCINKKYLRKIDKKNQKCILYYKGKSWEVPSSKSVTDQVEKLHKIIIN